MLASSQIWIPLRRPHQFELGFVLETGGVWIYRVVGSQGRRIHWVHRLQVIQVDPIIVNWDTYRVSRFLLDNLDCQLCFFGSSWRGQLTKARWERVVPRTGRIVMDRVSIDEVPHSFLWAVDFSHYFIRDLAANFGTISWSERLAPILSTLTHLWYTRFALLAIQRTRCVRAVIVRIPSILVFIIKLGIHLTFKVCITNHNSSNWALVLLNGRSCL